VDFGYFVRPSEETATGKARVEPCLGYVVEHPGGVLLFDTGMGSDPEVDARYRPRRHGLYAALAAAGTDVGRITHVANCHLHFDHCGGNPELVGRPVFVQAGELAEARNSADYTLPEPLDGGGFEELAGETEVLPGVFLLPTPGHTRGHQSLIVRRADGAVILAGQSHDTASEYAADHLSWQAHSAAHGEPLPEVPRWVNRLQDFDPRVVYFAHDHSIWVP
jgi:N-acyl homoserine lactone hydrolase